MVSGNAFVIASKKDLVDASSAAYTGVVGYELADFELTDGRPGENLPTALLPLIAVIIAPVGVYCEISLLSFSGRGVTIFRDSLAVGGPAWKQGAATRSRTGVRRHDRSSQ
jgi:hypothetical protein